MKRSSVLAAAFLSYLAAASPDDGACGAPSTVTVTQVITSNVREHGNPTQVTVTINANEHAAAIPSVVTNYRTQSVNGVANDVAVANPSAALPPLGSFSAAATSVVDSLSIQSSSSSTTDSASSFDASSDDTTDETVDTEDDDDSAPTTVTNVQTSTLDGGARVITVTNIETHYASEAGFIPAAKTVTNVFTSVINGAASTITVTSVMKQDVTLSSRVTTITKVYTSVIDGGARTVTVTKTEEHTLHPHHMLATGIKSGSGASPTHHVAVGKDGKMSFEPKFVNATKGDTVRFRFFPSNHTVTSSDFDTPCKRNDEFDSGFKPTNFRNSTLFTDYVVKDASKPMWFHSRQKDECKQGMVFAINPKDQDHFNKFSKNAMSGASNHTDSFTAASNATRIHTLNPTTNTTDHVLNFTSAKDVTRPISLRSRRGFTGGM